jgi:RNA polymerase sigma-70 factor (sigma-E family)
VASVQTGVSARDVEFDAFVRNSQAGLVRYATLLCGSPAEAEDIVQNVLIRVYAGWDRLVDVDGNVTAYVRRAITNEHISWRRRWSTRHIHLAETDVLHAVTEDPWASEHDDELWQRLGRLPVRQRAAVVLRYYEGLTDGEIADVIGCAQPTVRSHIHRALQALRAQDSAEDRHG